MMEKPQDSQSTDIGDDMLPSLLVETLSPKTTVQGNDELSLSANTSGWIVIQYVGCHFKMVSLLYSNNV